MNANPFRATAIFSAVLVALALAGCQTTQPKVVERVVEVKPEVPKSLLSCAPEPKLTEALIEALRNRADDGRDVTMFINALAEAGADCRTRLGAVRRILQAK